MIFHKKTSIITTILQEKEKYLLRKGKSFHRFLLLNFSS